MEDIQKDKKKQDETADGVQNLLGGNERVSQDHKSVREKENFHKLARIILDVLPKNLRQLFKDKWDIKFPNNKWDDTTASGTFLLSQVPKHVKKPMPGISSNLRKGDTVEWDPTTLSWVLLYSGLKLIAPCRVGGRIALPLLESEYIDMVREIRNTFFAHAHQASIKKDDFECIMLKLKTQTQFGGASLKTELEEIENSPIETELSMNLRQQLENQKKANNVLEDWLKNLDTRLDNVEKTSRENSKDVNNMKITHAELSRSLEETSENVKKLMKRSDEPRGVLQDIPELKKWYQDECAKHEVNCVVGDYIKPLLLDIKDFAVNLAVNPAVNLAVNRRAHEGAPSQSYHDELNKHVESLKSHTKTIEAGKTMNMVKDKDRERIVFVAGVAGIGKSVFAKRLAFDWSFHEMGTHIECLLYFTCGRFNNFFAECDNEQMEPEIIIQEYLKKEFRSLPVNNDETTLFLIDGLDELQEPEKVIQTFTKQFSKARFIILGRPHSEHIFYSITESYQHLEILGLKDDQIQEYIQKFDKISTGVTGDAQTTEPEVKSFSELIKSTLEKSTNIFAIKTIPQFLNTICCVVMLTREDKGITNRTELYSWTLFLLVKQHFQGKESHNQKPTVGSGIFADYSQQLLQVSKQAFQLYNEGTIIFKKKDLELTDDAFIEGFLLGIKNRLGEVSQFMFKHLTVMEFFTAIYVYFAEDRETLVNKLLENRHYEVVSFLCSFLRFSLVDEKSFEEDTVSYLLLKKIADGNKSEANHIHEMMSCQDAQKLIRGISDKVDEIQDEDRVKDTSPTDLVRQPGYHSVLKMRFIAECFEQTDEVSDTGFLEELLDTITPCSNVYLEAGPFTQLYLLNILNLASKNGLEAEIERIFNGFHFNLMNLKQMDILSHWKWLDIGIISLRNVVDFTTNQSISIHNNIAYCKRFEFHNCRVPSLLHSPSPNMNSPTLKATSIDNRREKMKLKLDYLDLSYMEVNELDSAGAANLFRLAENVTLDHVRIGQRVMEDILMKAIEMRPRRLKKISLHNCRLLDPEFTRMMKENGVQIVQEGPRSIVILCETESCDLILQLKRKLDDASFYIAINEKLVHFIRRYNLKPLVVIIFIHLEISKDVRKEILFAQKKEIKIVLVKLKPDFHPSPALNSVFELNPCLDYGEKESNDERAAYLNRLTLAMMDYKLMTILYAPCNKIEAMKIKEKFEAEIGCPVVFNVELKKYRPVIFLILMTDDYEQSEKCEEMINFIRSWCKRKIIAVKLDNDFQPGDELNDIVRESTCICWTDKQSFETNFAKVKEEINAEFAKLQ